MKKALLMMTMATAMLMACGSDDHGQDYNPLIDDPKEEEKPADGGLPADNSRNEQYRPQIHYTPAKNWMNDPNGLVFANGTYHLFYQYNPQGNQWGNMSWGHATSTDLMHWVEQPVALTRDELGAIFSGSCVIDKDNTAGFGAGAMVALYTSAGEKAPVEGKQQQSLAYSTDGGKNFTRYASNPVIKNDDDNLRDPKVFWHEPTHKWVMALAKGWKKGVELYGSTNLKAWQHLSTFVLPLNGRPELQWECPDLIQIGNKWVMLVSVNPGGPLVGSGMMYFTGDFDGTTFTADNAADGQTPVDPQWLDYGMDNYAGVTWSNIGDRHIMIGWMNNWAYSGDVPCSPWRSAFTLPRELSITEYEGKTLLCSTVVKEIDQIAGQWSDVAGEGKSFTTADAYQLRLTIGMDENSTVTLANEANEVFNIDIRTATRTMTVHRTAASGKTNFNGMFSIPSMNAPLCVDGNEVTLDIFVDQSSVEIFTQQGTMAMTNLVFPQKIYDRLTVTGANCKAQVRELKSVWQ